jgi:hypothetical protein
MKYLRSRLKKGVFGSIQLRIEDGNVIHVSEQNNHNPASFVDHCEQLPNRLVVRTYKSEDKKAVPETEQKPTNCSEVVKVDSDSNLKPTSGGVTSSGTEQEKDRNQQFLTGKNNIIINSEEGE